MRKPRCKYEYHNDGIMHARHTWSAIGSTCAVHLWITDHGENWEYGERYSGGIEIHYRHPPDYMKDDPPSHDECWLLKCPCWHDGSSLQASEHWIPLWLSDPHNHDWMFDQLCGELESRQSAFLGRLASMVTGEGA